MKNHLSTETATIAKVIDITPFENFKSIKVVVFIRF